MVGPSAIFQVTELKIWFGYPRQLSGTRLPERPDPAIHTYILIPIALSYPETFSVPCSTISRFCVKIYSSNTHQRLVSSFPVRAEVAIGPEPPWNHWAFLAALGLLSHKDMFPHLWHVGNLKISCLKYLYGGAGSPSKYLKQLV